MRKHVGPAAPTPPPALAGLAIADLAVAYVTSEAPGEPIERAFDGQRGPGASRWRASAPGEQTVVLAFDAPQSVRRTAIEIEERERGRTQELSLAASTDGGQTYREIVRQEFVFSPPGTTFEHESWDMALTGVTHLRLIVRPDKGDATRYAALTSWAVWG